jgi:phosphoglucomutase
VDTSPSPLRGEGRGGGENEPSPAALAEYNRWLTQPDLDPSMKEELLTMQNDPEQIENHFGQELVFGTGGMRGLIGPGLNRINCYIIRRATQGLADYLNAQQSPSGKLPAQPRQVAIAYDTRLYSAEFAEAAALVLAANGIKALLSASVRPTPLLSYITRALGCAAGIVVTASHNPPQYNGYKVYGPDGGQAVSPLVDDLIAAIKPVDIFSGVKSIKKEEAIKLGLFELINPAHDQDYINAVKALSLSNPEQCIKVVFTPLHGTGSVFIPDLLRQTRCVELHLVEEQMQPDHNFSTVRVPNPEDPAALKMALELADQVEADLVLATDPDGDRVGTAIRDQDGNMKILSGNQMGALLIDYICSRHQENGTMPADPVLVKTIVTGDLGRRVAESHGLNVVETLTGFKFIGEQMQLFEDHGTPHFVFGYEESCGYLTGTFVRDKDAVIASFLIAEMTAYYKEKGLNLLQVLEQIQQKVGYYRDELLTVALQDISEADRHVAAFNDLPAEFAGQKVVEKRDYETGRGLNLKNGEQFDLTLPRSPVLHYTLADGSWFAVRPSGTEPKVKFYLSVCAPTAEAADQQMTSLREAVIAMAG